ncbi:MAG: hypothetical protein JXN64_05830 [Spirochaetes bacterium]|nr:hypothetical protein [Spirochaetota bacterium]
MKVSHQLNTLIKQRLFFISAGTLSLCLVLWLLFYSLFLLMPSVFIKAGLIAPFPLLIIFTLSLIISLSVYLYRMPLFGKRFFNEILLPPYSANDLKSALELESGKSYPRTKGDSSLEEKNISSFFSGQFIENVSAHIKLEKRIFAGLVPDIKRLTVCTLIIIISMVLSIIKSDLVFDVYSALRTGLPAELIALDAPVKYEKIEAVITPPAYIESGISTAVDLTVHDKIKVMQGSGVSVKGILNNIKSGKLILSTGKGLEYFTAAIFEEKFFEAAFLAPAKGAFALEFEFIKLVSGKSRGKSKVYTIEALPDQPPSIKIFFPPSVHNVLFGNPVEINFTASDDYGILEISLYHRNPEENSGYYREIVARFPKDPKTNYSASHVWNPVIREGEKMDELVYDPGTKSVEYFLEVKDINIYSEGGTAKSETRYVYFTDALADLKEGINLIRELIDDGKKLLQSPGNKRIAENYKKKLAKAVQVFSKERQETMPQSTLVQKTNEMLSVFYIDSSKELKESLRSYIAYLERFLVFMQLLLETESAASIDKELSRNDDMKSSMDNSLKRISRAAELMENEFKKDIEEIEELLRKGDQAGARAKTLELLDKIKKRMEEEIAKSMAMSQKIADEMKDKLDKMAKLASELLKKQEANRTITDKGNIKGASADQEEINEGLRSLSAQTEKLSSEYPFVMYSLNSYAGAAKIYGARASEALSKSEPGKSSKDQSRVIQYLNNFMNASNQQKQLMEELAKGNFESIMQRGYTNRFVLIPKEAVYTIPIDYKNKIIEMSKDRSRLTKEKEAFWRDILQ